MHKENGVQAGVLSLPPEERFDMENILLLAISRASVYKKYGMARVLCGVDKDGKRHDAEENYGTDMRALDEGVWITIPDDKLGGSKRVRLRVWQLVVSADMLGANSLLPFMETPGAHVFCRQCNVNQSRAGAYRTFSFLRKPPEGYHPKLRVWSELKQFLVRLRSDQVSVTQRKREMQEHGLNSLYYAMDPEYVPHVNPCEDFIQDGLHLFGDGLLRSTGAWLFFVFCLLGLDLDVVNTAVRRYPHFEKGVRVPELHPGLKTGAAGVAGRVPRAEAVLRMSGSECAQFALHRCAQPRCPRGSHATGNHLHNIACSCSPRVSDCVPDRVSDCVSDRVSCASHSIEILTPLLTSEMLAHPAWHCWVKLVELYTVFVLHSLTQSDLKHLDDLQLAYSLAFDRVPEFVGLKRPKHHFLSHIALDAWRFGPGRGYWCYGFEGFNKVIKRGAKRCNFKCEPLGIMSYHAEWTARNLAKRQRV